MGITPERLGQISDFDSLAAFLHEELGWEPDHWQIYQYVREAYGLPNSLPPVAAITNFGDPRWGVFLVDFGNETMRASKLHPMLNAFAEKTRETDDNPHWKHDNILFIIRHSGTGFSFGLYTGEQRSSAKLHHFGWTDPNAARTTILRNLPALRWECRDEWHQAWNAEKLTRDFFLDYKAVFSRVESAVTGLHGDDVRRFTQSLLNRLMFLAFLQEKGWLEIHGQRKEYLFRLFDGFEPNPGRNVGEAHFLDRLNLLFFSGLNSRNGDGGDRDQLQPLIGRVPFLNGGLFEPDQGLDYVGKIADDSVFDLLLGERGLFRRYTFTATESTALTIEVAVDPEMLGKIFEELVVGRHQTGSYYTPRAVVSFMCREAVKGYLGETDAVVRLVDGRDPADIGVTEARALIRKLEAMRVCDPACGSGAYLLGMLQEIHSLQQMLDTRADEERSDYARKEKLIENCLYGADIDPFAVRIAWLRLWLSLVVDSDLMPLDNPADADRVALPNLDAKIACGDSLLGFPPVELMTDIEGLHREAIIQYRILKGQYLRAHSKQEKTILRAQLGELRSEISDWLRTQPCQGAIDWTVEFAEVFISDGTDADSQGFDVVLANPPYISALEFSRQYPASYRRELNRKFETARGAYDLYVLFFELALSLLAPGGQLAFITPNKYLSAPYAMSLREYIRTSATHRLLVDLSRLDVFAAVDVYPVLTFLKKGNEGSFEFSCLRPPSYELTSDQIPEFIPAVFRSDALDMLPEQIWGFLLSEHADLLARLLPSETLADHFQINATTTAGEADLYGAQMTEDDGQGANFRVVNTGTIDPFRSLWGVRPLRHSGRQYLHPVLRTDCVGPRRATLYSVPKVLFSKIGRACEAFFDQDGSYGGLNINCAYAAVPETSLMFLCGYAHSSLFHFFYEQFFGALRMSGGYLQFQAPQLRVIPSCLPSEHHDRIVELTQEIEALARDGESYSQLHALVDAKIMDVFNVDESDRYLVRQVAREAMPIAPPGVAHDDWQDYYLRRLRSDGTFQEWLARRAAQQNTEIERIRLLCERGEGQEIEFKASVLDPKDATNKVKPSILEDIVAFLNTCDGDILIGVDDDGNVVGLESFPEQLPNGSIGKFLDKLAGYVMDRIAKSAHRYITIREPVHVEGKTVVRVSVIGNRSAEFSVGNRFYVRFNRRSQELTGVDLGDELAHRRSLRAT